MDMILASSICIARRATSTGNTKSVLVNTIWYLVWDLQIGVQNHQLKFVIRHNFLMWGQNKISPASKDPCIILSGVLFKFWKSTMKLQSWTQLWQKLVHLTCRFAHNQGEFGGGTWIPLTLMKLAETDVLLMKKTRVSCVLPFHQINKLMIPWLHTPFCVNEKAYSL